ncbi:hypothetical protein QQG55_47710 [Brugia pahangi]
MRPPIGSECHVVSYCQTEMHKLCNECTLRDRSAALHSSACCSNNSGGEKKQSAKSDTRVLHFDLKHAFFISVRCD